MPCQKGMRVLEPLGMRRVTPREGGQQTAFSSGRIQLGMADCGRFLACFSSINCRSYPDRTSLRIGSLPRGDFEVSAKFTGKSLDNTHSRLKVTLHILQLL